MRKNKEIFFISILYLLLPLIGFWRNFDPSGLNLSFFHVDFIGYYFPDFLQGIKVVSDIFSFKPLADTLWDSHNMLGYPLIGAIDRIELFYPIRFIFYLVAGIFPEKYHLFFATYYSLFHMSVAAIFSYIFVRRYFKLSPFAAFITGTIYALSGAFVFISIFSNVIIGPALLPLILYLLCRAIEKKSYKYALLAGFAYSPILVGGYTQTYLYNNIFIILFLVFFFVKSKDSLIQSFKQLLLANFTAITLSAVILIPSIEIKMNALRQELNIFGSAGHSFTVESLFNYIIPHIYGLDQNGTVFGYIGVAAMYLVYIAANYSRNKITKFLIFSSLLFFILSLGNVTFLHSLFYKFVPFYNQFRFLSFFHYLVAFCLAILAGIGADIIESRKIVQMKLYVPIKNIFIIFSSIWFGLFIIKPLIQPSLKNINVINEMTYSMFPTFIFITATFLLIKYLYTKRLKYFKLILGLMIIIDLFTLISKTTFVNSDYDPRIFITPSHIVAPYRNELKDVNSRIYLNESTLRFNSAMADFHQIEGFHGLTLNNYNLLLNHFQKSGTVGFDSPLLDMLAVRYIVSSQALEGVQKNIEIASKNKLGIQDYGRFLTRNGTRIPTETDIYVYRNTDALARSYLVGKVKKVATDQEAVDNIDRVDIRREALITTQKNTPNLSFNSIGSSSKINIYRSSYIRADVVSNGTSLLVLSDIYFPGWEAYVDGKKTDIFKANIALRGVYIPNGKHVVEFRYRPFSFYSGLFVSFIFFTIYVLLIYKKTKNKNKNKNKNER